MTSPDGQRKTGKFLYLLVVSLSVLTPARIRAKAIARESSLGHSEYEKLFDKLPNEQETLQSRAKSGLRKS